jgi:hypothetical protein
MPFETFGFATSYSVDLNPEQPGAGWGDQKRVVFRAGGNEAILAEVTPKGGSPWLAIDGAVAGGTPWLCATPNADVICFSAGPSEFGGRLIDVTRTESFVEFGPYGSRAFGSPELGLLLLMSDTEMVAVGDDGILWTSERLALDDLVVVSASPDGIICEGLVDDFDVPSRFTVDPATGKHLDGPDYAKGFRTAGPIDLLRWAFSEVFRRKNK